MTRWTTMTAAEVAAKSKANRAARITVAKQAPKTRLSEKLVMKGCIDILSSHPKVALFWRQNTGAAKMKGDYWVKFSFKGASDLMAVMVGGKFLAVECKATGEKASKEQDAFLLNVYAAGAYSICVDDPQQLIDFLG